MAWLYLPWEEAGEVWVGDVALPGEWPGLRVWAVPVIEGGEAGCGSGGRVVEVRRQEDGALAGVAWEKGALRGVSLVRRCGTGVFECSCEAEVREAFSPEAVGWEMVAGLRGVRALSSAYEREALRGDWVVDAWTPLLIEGWCAARFVRVVGVSRFAAVEIRPRGGEAVSWRMWADHAGAHPRVTFCGSGWREWVSRYRWERGARLGVRFCVVVSRRRVPGVVVGRYPPNYDALFCITDHADHDTPARVAAVLWGSSARRGRRAGLAGMGLPFTKSVFPETDAAGGAGLHNEAFVRLCREARAAGVEICPHGVHESRQPAPEAVTAVLERFREFGPATWIDHGRTLRSNYSMEGWRADSEYYLRPHLEALGIRYVWGYLDFAHLVPAGGLNLLAAGRFTGRGVAGEAWRVLWRAVAVRRPLAIVHAVAATGLQLVPEEVLEEFMRLRAVARRAMWEGRKGQVAAGITEGLRLLRGVCGAGRWRAVAEAWERGRPEVRLLPVFFREHETAGRAKGGLWLFNTVAVNDVAGAYSEENIERLLCEYGLHIGHTYLTSVSRGHASAAIEAAGGGEWRITEGFGRRLERIAALRDAGRLWVATMHEAGDYFSRLADVVAYPVSPDRWEIRTEGGGEGPDVQVIVLDSEGSVEVGGRAVAPSPFRSDGLRVTARVGREAVAVTV